MQVISNVHLLSLGFVNAYLIVGDDGLTVIDTGMDKKAKRIFKSINELGFSPKDIKHILITHTDVDHVRGAKALIEASGAKIFTVRWKRKHCSVVNPAGT